MKQMRENTAKRNGRCMHAAVVLIGLALFSSSCGMNRGPEMIAEKSLSPSETEDEMAEGVGAAGVSGALETDVSNTESSNIREMVQAPRRYQASFTGTDMRLTADALVEVPDVKGITIKKVTNASYTEEEYEALRTYTAKKMDMTWKEPIVEELPEGTVFYNSVSEEEKDVSVELYYVKSAEETLMRDNAYNTYMGMWSGQAYQYRVRKEDFPEDFAEELKTGKLLREMGLEAEKIMRETGHGDVALQSARWVIGYDSAAGTKVQDKIPMAEYVFTKEVDGISVLYGELPPPYTHEYQRDEYEQVMLDRNGKLIHLYFAQKQAVTDKTKEEQFLLPFSEISQIFEQVMKSSHPTYGLIESASDTELEYAFSVNTVKLGYQSTFEKQGEELKREGKMIPVWNFYGDVEITGHHAGETMFSQKFTSPAQVLMTINAMDGTVLIN